MKKSSFLNSLALKQAEAGSMPNDDNADNTKSDVLEFAVRALTKHESQMDEVISKIEAKKDELLTRSQNLNASIEEITRKLDDLDNEIKKLKKILTT